MTTLTNNAEGGSNGTTVTTANSGGTSGTAFDGMTIGTNAALTFDSTRSAHGSLSYKVSTGVTTVGDFLAWNMAIGGSATYYYRVYIYLTALPPITFYLLTAWNSGTAAASLQIQADGTLRFLNSTGTSFHTSTATVATGQWVRIEGFFTGAASTGQASYSLYNTMDSTTATESYTSAATQSMSGSLTELDFGITRIGKANIGPFWMDDLGISTTGLLGPAVTGVSGTGSVARHKPTVAATEVEKISGTVSVARHKPTLAATEVEKISGTVSVARHKPTLAATEVEKISGTVSVSRHKPTVAATEVEKISGTVSVARHKPTLGGQNRLIGTGSVARHKPSLAATEVEKISGTVSVARHKPTLAATEVEKIKGTVAIVRHKPSLAATEVEKISGTGSVARHKPSIFAADSVAIHATVAVTRHKPKVSGVSVQTGPVLWNTFEGISSGTTITTGNSGGTSGNKFDAVTSIAGSTIAADNSFTGLGSIGLKVATTTTTGTPAAEWLLASLGVARTLLYFRVDFLKTTTATPACRPITLTTTGGTHIMSIAFSGNAMFVSYGSGFTSLTSFTSVIPNNQYVKVQGWIDTAAGTISVDYFAHQKDAVPTESHVYTGLTLGTAIQRVNVGNGNNATSAGPFWIDLAAVSPDGPLSQPNVVSRKPSISASGVEKEAGTEAVTRHKPSISGTGGQIYAKITRHKPSIAGTEVEKISGTVSVSRHKPSISATEVQRFSGTGAVTRHKPTIAATEVEKISGTGSVTRHKMSLVVSGKEQQSGSGTVKSLKPRLFATGRESYLGNCVITRHKMGVAGAGKEQEVGTGSISISKPVLRASGTTEDISRSSSLFMFSPL